MSKVSKEFKETIKNYLDNRAAEDELFAVTYQKENKNIEECCNYVMKCAKDGGCAGYDDKDVFGWAVHYYDEDNIKDIKPISGKVLINRALELTEDEKKEAKQKAIDSLVADYKEEAKKELISTIELTAEDIADAKKIALEKVVDSERAKILTKTPKKKAEPVTEGVTYLFSM